MKRAKEVKWEKYDELRKLLGIEIEELEKELEAKEKEVRHLIAEQDKLS